MGTNFKDCAANAVTCCYVGARLNGDTDPDDNSDVCVVELYAAPKTNHIQANGGAYTIFMPVPMTKLTAMASCIPMMRMPLTIKSRPLLCSRWQCMMDSTLRDMSGMCLEHPCAVALSKCPLSAMLHVSRQKRGTQLAPMAHFCVHD